MYFDHVYSPFLSPTFHWFLSSPVIPFSSFVVGFCDPMSLVGVAYRSLGEVIYGNMGNLPVTTPEENVSPSLSNH